MKSTMIYKKLDVVLIPFPFTDLSATKKRPGLIISPDQYNKNLDVIIAFITSKLDTPHQLGDYKIMKSEKSGLPKPSMIRMKFATIDKSIIFKTLGSLHEPDSKKFTQSLINFFTH
ncbi:MAG: type II toxin-antitoxin system PemK/MazF family toxin [Desulfobacula sp.]|jgi:mRNA interferase MazF|nr:type II toxin-antitoxin system PemK/MazF family toxin [Desulfobacula sp.]